MRRTAIETEGRLLALTRATRRSVAATLAVAMGVLAWSATLLASPASAAPGDLAGTWASVDLDGSNQTLDINGAGNPVYSVFLRDDFTSGGCGGPPAKLVGHGLADGDALFVVGTLVCLPGGNPIPGERLGLVFEYDVATDTLTDDSGVVWERIG